MLGFAILAVLAVAGALGVIAAKNPVHSVLALVVNFLALAVSYLLLSAEFMAVIQLIIYAGAIMVLFLFVIGLLTVRRAPVEQALDRLKGQVPAAVAVAAALALLLAAAGVAAQGAAAKAGLPGGFGTVAQFGRDLLTTHVLPFELTAFVLLVAVIGVVVLVGRKQA